MFNKIKYRLFSVGYGIYLIRNTVWHFGYSSQLLHYTLRTVE